MAAAYFELLCNANGLVTICMSIIICSYHMPNVNEIIAIPEIIILV